MCVASKAGVGGSSFGTADLQDWRASRKCTWRPGTAAGGPGGARAGGRGVNWFLVL